MLDILQIIHDYWLLLLIGAYPNGPIGGLAATIILSAIVLVLSIPLGIAMGVARLSSWRLLRGAVTVWVYAVRGVPLLMLVFWAYFLLPLLLGHSLSVFLIMVCTLTIYQSAFICEIVRGGLLALPAGQTEAARALGLGPLRTTFWVLLPQAIFNVAPSLVSQLISIIKETTVGYVINLAELTFSANQINNVLLVKPFQVFFILAMTYYALCVSLSRFSRFLENRVATRRSRGVAIGMQPKPKLT